MRNLLVTSCAAVIVGMAGPALAQGVGPALAIPSTTKFIATENEPWRQELLIIATDEKQADRANLVAFQMPARDAEGKQSGEVKPLEVRSLTGSDKIDRRAPIIVVVEATFAKVGLHQIPIFASVGGAAVALDLMIDVRSKPVKTGHVEVLPVTATVGATIEMTDGEAPIVDVKLTNSSDAVVELRVASIAPHLVDEDGARADVITATPLEIDVKIPPKASSHAFVKLAGVSRGEYKGDLELVLADQHAAPIPATMTIAARRDWYWAAGAIAFGVIVGLGVSVWLGKLQPRIELHLEVTSFLEKLAEIDPKVESLADVKRRMRANGIALAAHVRGTGGETMRDKVTAFAGLVACFAAANDAANQIAKLSPETQRQKRAILDQALAIIGDADGNPATAKQKLAELALATARREELVKALDAVELSATEHAASDDPALALSVEHEVAVAIAIARKALETEDLVVVTDQLQRARTALAGAGTRSILAALESHPAFVTPEEWGNVRRAASAAVTLAQGDPDRYERVRDAYVDALAKLFVDIATRLNTAAPDDELKAAIVKVAKSATGPRSERVRAVRALQQKLTPTKSTRAALAPTVFDASSLPAAPAASVAMASATPAMPENLARRARGIHLSVTAVVFVLALLGGLQVLWLDHPTWGSSGDLLAAFLWGTTAKLSADLFAGLGWLRTVLKTP